MSASIGISSLLSLVSCPSGCVYNEVSKEISKVTKAIKNSVGVTVQVGQLPMVTTKVTCKGRGFPSLSVLVTATPSVSTGTLVVTSADITEDHEDWPEFTIGAESRS